MGLAGGLHGDAHGPSGRARAPDLLMACSQPSFPGWEAVEGGAGPEPGVLPAGWEMGGRAAKERGWSGRRTAAALGVTIGPSAASVNQGSVDGRALGVIVASGAGPPPASFLQGGQLRSALRRSEADSDDPWAGVEDAADDFRDWELSSSSCELCCTKPSSIPPAIPASPTAPGG